MYTISNSNNQYKLPVESYLILVLLIAIIKKRYDSSIPGLTSVVYNKLIYDS